MKKVISTIMLIALLTSMTFLSSCESSETGWFYSNWVRSGGDTYTYLPDWYIGGYNGIRSQMSLEYYWVETYDEVLDAMERLKSHGSTFADSGFAAYDGDLVDVKYCFTMKRDKSDKIKYGDDPFDRKSLDVTIRSVVFLEEVTIDELVRGYVASYDTYEILCPDWAEFKDADISELDQEWIYGEEGRAEYYRVWSDNRNHVINIGSESRNTNIELLSDEVIEALLDSIVIVAE